MGGWRLRRPGIAALAVSLLTMVAIGATPANSATRTALVKDINAGAGSSKPADMISVGGTLLFEANDGTHGFELWKSTGSAGRATLVKDINPGPSSSGPTPLHGQRQRHALLRGE